MTFRLKGASGTLTDKAFDLGEDTRIGSAADADIRLDDADEQHCRIVFDGKVLMLECAGEVWVNGMPVKRSPLVSGDEIRVGPHRFVLQAPGLRPASVLDRAGKRAVNPWTWVVIAAFIAAGIAAVLVFVLRQPFS